jgi:hypothetical protein
MSNPDFPDLPRDTSPPFRNPTEIQMTTSRAIVFARAPWRFVSNTNTTGRINQPNHASITPMTHQLDQHVRVTCNMSFSPPRGFVLAMRAKLIYAAPLPAKFEWIIITRWGSNGEHLALGWTSIDAAAGEPPIHLAPRQTALAHLIEAPVPGMAAAFRLAATVPNGTNIAGKFVPAQGSIRLVGEAPALRLESKGKSLSHELHPNWRISATQAPWFGEFIDSDPQA